jgi:hypothetical protein
MPVTARFQWNLRAPWAAAVALSSISACVGTRQRVVVVSGADVETRLASQACPEVTKKLGAAASQRLLEGHLVRRGAQLVIVVREWRRDGAFPLRRVTMSVGADEELSIPLPSSQVRLFADRVSPDGRNVVPLEPKSGRIVVRHADQRVFVALDIDFTDGAEGPVRIAGWFDPIDVYRLDPATGRIVPGASPGDYLGR